MSVTNKGLWTRIQDLNIVSFNNNLIKSDLEKCIQNIKKEEALRRKEREKYLKELHTNINKKEKELGKIIPPELYISLFYQLPQGIEFFKKYEEWIAS